MLDSNHELFVISDLHIGGKYSSGFDRGFRINTHVNELTLFIQQLTQHSNNSASSQELVINGDFIDFLAQEGSPEKPWTAFIDNPDDALKTYMEIYDQDRNFFNALNELSASGCDITLLLGNHDIELSFPVIRQYLKDQIEAKKGGRLTFIYDGEAYAVGDVVIEHGNRYDGFNVVNHDQLRSIRSSISRHEPISAADEFIPPPGSLLVADIMNPIKKSYGFVDLLKPETEAVIPLLLALEPGYLKDVEKLWKLRKLKSAAHRLAPKKAEEIDFAGFTGIEYERGEGSSTLSSILNGHVDTELISDLQTLCAETEITTSIAEPNGILSELENTFSMLKLKVSDKTYRSRMNLLLRTLRNLRNDYSFDVNKEIPGVIRHAEQLVSHGFKTVIFGHTHLAKEIKLADDATYINTGTWAELMKLPTGLFEPEKAKEVLEKFVSNLKSKNYDDYIIYKPTFAHVVMDNNRRTLSAKLCFFNGQTLDN